MGAFTENIAPSSITCGGRGCLKDSPYIGAPNFRRIYPAELTRQKKHPAPEAPVVQQMKARGGPTLPDMPHTANETPMARTNRNWKGKATQGKGKAMKGMERPGKERPGEETKGKARKG